MTFPLQPYEVNLSGHVILDEGIGAHLGGGPVGSPKGVGLSGPGP